MRMCAELAEIGMTLARAVATRALTDLSEPEQPEQPATKPDAAPDPNRAPRLRTAGTSLRAPTCKSIHPALLFTRIAATVRDLIALEARLAAAPPATSRATPSLLRRADPRRALLRDAFHLMTENHPDRAALRRHFATRLDEHLAADAAEIIDDATMIAAICEELALDVATLPDRQRHRFLTPPPDD